MISASARISVLVVCLSLRVSYSDTALVRTFDSRVELNAARQGARDTPPLSEGRARASYVFVKKTSPKC
jgi:hypothetical protein